MLFCLQTLSILDRVNTEYYYKMLWREKMMFYLQFMWLLMLGFTSEGIIKMIAGKGNQILAFSVVGI